ncbi:MAG: hypothetical protein LBR05_03650 [Azoarcus sp.]|jgi:hypothetical protein|nr:hypothetical protein [Azoarcus sp.]
MTATFENFATLLFISVLGCFFGISTGIFQPLIGMSEILYYGLTAISLLVLIGGVFFVLSGVRKHKKALRSQGEILLLAGAALWTFLSLWQF